ncbi:sulfate adenylyltransferase subunit 1 [Dermacoccaceae bacterium W4C1]
MGSLLRLATAGSVDDGKSTLVGRLLHDTKSVLADQLAAVERVSKDKGLTEVDLALLTDGLRAEREQGITIDVAYRYFATATRSFVLADCPGHEQYTRNTVTGASTADVLVVLVDVRHGVVEQTRRHLAVAALLRVPHVIVAVNKIDLVDYSEADYLAVAEQVAELTDRLGIADTWTVPVSALAGDNIVETSTNTPWYTGPALLQLLEGLQPDATREREGSSGGRLPVQTVIRPQQAAVEPHLVDYRGYAGYVSGDRLSVGQEVVVLPSGKRTTIVGIDLAGTELEYADPGRSVTLRLADQIDISRGDLIAAAQDAPATTRQIEGVVCWLSDRPLRAGDRLELKHGTANVKTVVSALHGRLDVGTLVPQEVQELGLNDLGHLTLRVGADLPVEPYETHRSTGSFLLIDPADGATLAAGMAGSRWPVAEPAAAGA